MTTNIVRYIERKELPTGSIHDQCEWEGCGVPLGMHPYISGVIENGNDMLSKRHYFCAKHAAHLAGLLGLSPDPEFGEWSWHDASPDWRPPADNDEWRVLDI